MDDEPMWATDRVVTLTFGSTITTPEPANEFAIKGNHLTLIKGNQFDGRTKTDPHKHIREFLRIYDMFKYRYTKNEAVCLMMFPISLTREAKTWLDELNKGTIVTWDELRTAFISRLFPPALFDRLLREIHCGVTHEPYQCQQKNHDYYHEQNSCYDSNSIGFDQPQPHQYTANHPIFSAHHDLLGSQKKLNITLTKVNEQMTSLTSLCELACQIAQKNLEEKQLEEEQAAKAQNWKLPVCYDDDDDEESSNSLKDNSISELPSYSTVIPSEPVDSLSMGDDHLNTIPATKSDEFIKSCIEKLVPNPSESEGENECDVPAGFTTFFNVLFDADYDFDSGDDQSFSDEDFPKKIYSNPLFDEEINPMEIDQHSFNVESDLIESLPNHDSSIFISSKIDSLFDEFVGELTLLKLIPLGIDEIDCHSEKEIRLTKRLLYDNSSPRPPEEIIFDNSNADIESFSPSPIPNKDSDSHMEEIDLPFTPDDPMPDIPILEELLDNYSVSLPANESYHFDIPSPYRPPAKPPDGITRTLNIKMPGDVSDQKASPHDSELVSLEVAEIVIPKDEEIEDDNLREKLLNVNLLIAKIEALKDNHTPSSEFLTKSSSTSLKSFLEETNTFDNSLPEFENFCFDLEEISSGSTTTHSDISLPDYESFSFYDDHIEEISSGSTTTHSDISLPDYESFSFYDDHIEEISSGCTTTHSDISLSKYDSFIFDLSNDQFPPTDRSDFTHEEFGDELDHIISPPKYDCFYFRDFPNPGEWISSLNFGIHENLSSTTRVNLPVEDDHSPLLAYVVWIFLAYLTYPIIPPYLHSFGNENTIFDPGITINHFYSFNPGLSHRCGTFKKFNTHRSHLNKRSMEMLFSTFFPMDQ
nr:reverse transcriptase domain-containing protein [Tanacetum cinerariifolium]